LAPSAALPVTSDPTIPTTSFHASIIYISIFKIDFSMHEYRSNKDENALKKVKNKNVAYFPAHNYFRDVGQSLFFLQEIR